VIYKYMFEECNDAIVILSPSLCLPLGGKDRHSYIQCYKTMKVKAIKTHKIDVTEGEDFYEFLDKYVTELPEQSIVAVTSKIISVCDARIAPTSSMKKFDLIRNESLYYIPPEQNKYGKTITIMQNRLLPDSGIDESNGDGFYILWPDTPESFANGIRAFLKKKFGTKEFGVIVTDSATVPMRWGTTGVALAYSGFIPVKDYKGEKDLFGKILQHSRANIADSIATACVLMMGEGNESKPIAIAEELDFVEFVDNDPSDMELGMYLTTKETDLYHPILEKGDWRSSKDDLAKDYPKKS